MKNPKSVGKKEKIYIETINSFLHSKTPEDAIKVLITAVRKIDELPIEIMIQNDEAGLLDAADDQVKIKEIFKEILERKTLEEISPIHDFAFCYYSHFLSMVDVDKNTIWADPPHFYEDTYPSTAIIGHCLIELLKSCGDQMHQYLHSCQRCKEYFIAKKIDERIKHCSSCAKLNNMTPEERKAYDKGRRAIIKRRNEVHKLNEFIERMMKEHGWTEKEARDQYEYDQNIKLSTDKSGDN